MRRGATTVPSGTLAVAPAVSVKVNDASKIAADLAAHRASGQPRPLVKKVR